MTFVERRKGDGFRTLDRRRTYIDVVERVLGTSLPFDLTNSPTVFVRFVVGQLVIGSTVSEVQIHFLGDATKDHRRN